MRMKMKKIPIINLILIIVIYISCILIFQIPNSMAQGTRIVDNITNNTTWEFQNSPYWIENDIRVLPNVNLTIEPGVEVEFNGFYAIYIEGNLIAMGLEHKIITITSNHTPPTYWNRIQINNTGHVYLENTDMSYADNYFTLSHSSNNSIINNSFSNWAGGIFLSHSSNNTIINNIISSHSGRGIFLDFMSDNNVVANNTIQNNKFEGIGIINSYNNIIIGNDLINNRYGIFIDFVSSDNRIFHNNLINNLFQAFDDAGINYWNDSYPSGGNYWSDYTGGDSFSGPNQDIDGGDGIGDNSYFFDMGKQDYYPLMVPFDHKPPKLSNLSITPNPGEVHGYVNISVSIKDNLNRKFGAWINITEPSGSVTQNYSLLYDMNNDLNYLNINYSIVGSYGFTIWTNDTSNNWNHMSGEFGILDTTEPILMGVVAHPSKQEVYGNINITASINDNYQVFEVWLNVTPPNGQVSNNSMKYDSVNERYYLNSTYFTIGIYTFTIFGFDSSLNFDLYSEQFEIVDTVPPEITLLSSPSESLINESMKISVNVSDNIGVNEVNINYIDVDGIAHNESMNLMEGIYTYNISTQMSEGIVTFFIWSDDTSGNSIITTTYTIDINVPIVDKDPSDGSWLFFILITLSIFAFILILILYLRKWSKK